MMNIISWIIGSLLNSIYQKRLNSLNEKLQQHEFVEHWLYVHELQDLLNKLQPNDWVTPNEVHNLAVNRISDGKYIGYIDFALNELCLDDENHKEKR